MNVPTNVKFCKIQRNDLNIVVTRHRIRFVGECSSHSQLFGADFLDIDDGLFNELFVANVKQNAVMRGALQAWQNIQMMIML